MISLRLIFVSANFYIQRSEYRNNISSEISQRYFEQKTILLQKLYYETVGEDTLKVGSLASLSLPPPSSSDGPKLRQQVFPHSEGGNVNDCEQSFLNIAYQYWN